MLFRSTTGILPGSSLGSSFLASQFLGTFLGGSSGSGLLLVIGWCDTKGSVAVNKRISRQRAETVKTWLVRKGIEASRITAIGNGSDGSLEAGKARRVETTDNNK